MLHVHILELLLTEAHPFPVFTRMHQRKRLTIGFGNQFEVGTMGEIIAAPTNYTHDGTVYPLDTEQRIGWVLSTHPSYGYAPTREQYLDSLLSAREEAEKKAQSAHVAPNEAIVEPPVRDSSGPDEAA